MCVCVLAVSMARHVCVLQCRWGWGAGISLGLLEVMPAQQGLLQGKQRHWDQLAQLQRTPATIQPAWGTRWKAILLCQPGMGKARVQCSRLPKLQIAFHQGKSLAAPRCLHLVSCGKLHWRALPVSGGWKTCCFQQVLLALKMTLGQVGAEKAMSDWDPALRPCWICSWDCQMRREQLVRSRGQHLDEIIFLFHPRVSFRADVFLLYQFLKQSRIRKCAKRFKCLGMLVTWYG